MSVKLNFALSCTCYIIGIFFWCGCADSCSKTWSFFCEKYRSHLTWLVTSSDSTKLNIEEKHNIAFFGVTALLLETILVWNNIEIITLGKKQTKNKLIFSKIHFKLLKFRSSRLEVFFIRSTANNFIQIDSPIQLFSCEFCRIVTEHHLVTGSEILLLSRNKTKLPDQKILT